MAQDRIVETFQRLLEQKETALIPYLTVGVPDMDTTLELVPELAKAGAHIIELGVPFSDPLADGATIQKANLRALNQGVNLRGCIDLCSRLRNKGVEVPLILMGYYNPILTIGIEEYAKLAAEAGIDGTIVPDLPPEECGPLREASLAQGLHIIPLLAPTSTEERIAKASAVATGFVYCVSLTGVTGARDQVAPGVFTLVKRVRKHTKLPIAIGFGLSRRDHIVVVGEHAEAAVVGSALVNIIDSAPRNEVVVKARNFIAELSSSIPSVTRGDV
ncbi:MAG: tryptophan synthase subunit alpha [SAR202 cluster bacterium Io17-Chloro-G3]|nr:MAG: tryptophan synthase subunit alpha [SAR202 cluster bacterium Io17-Chloro-G3]